MKKNIKGSFLWNTVYMDLAVKYRNALDRLRVRLNSILLANNITN